MSSFYRNWTLTLNGLYIRSNQPRAAESLSAHFESVTNRNHLIFYLTFLFFFSPFYAMPFRPMKGISFSTVLGWISWWRNPLTRTARLRIVRCDLWTENFCTVISQTIFDLDGTRATYERDFRFRAFDFDSILFWPHADKVKNSCTMRIITYKSMHVSLLRFSHLFRRRWQSWHTLFFFQFIPD